jgi:hydroxymethylpyrimidine pyrophosphatase-like HAD family hydrolase
MTTAAPTSLLCFDFDGTLVDHAEGSVERPAQVSACWQEEVRQWQARGAAWVINTGRSLGHAVSGVGEHDLALQPDFIIAREHEIYQRTVAGDYADFGSWNDECHRRHRHFYPAHEPLFVQLRQFLARHGLGRWVSVPHDPAGLITDTEDQMQRIVDFLTPLAERWPELGLQRNTIYLRFTHRDYDKGSALRALRDQLGLTAADVIVAGDNLNDLAMLQREVAHHLICPANSHPTVKEQVSAHGGYISAALASRGVSDGLRRFRGAA